MREVRLILKSLLSSFLPSRQSASERRIPKDSRVYAFGDVHGRADLLNILLDAVTAETMSKQRSWSQTHVIGLGDYVDRGQQSRQVIELLVSLSTSTEIQLTALRGNHEEAMLAALNDPAAIAPWLDFGGAATLSSYGIAPVAGVPTPQRLERISAQLQVALPTAHIDFLKATADSLHLGDYFFVHAGIRPRLGLDRQDRNDLLWIRHEFLASRRFHGAMIVHGHHIVDTPEIRHNRIGLDTGAYCTGVLTCLVLEGAESWLMQATPQGIRKIALPPK